MRASKVTVQVDDGATVLINQADNRQPAVIELPTQRLEGDFFLQLDTMWCPTLGQLEVALVGNRGEVTFDVTHQGGRVGMTLQDAPWQYVTILPGGCPVSYRLERRGTAYTLCTTGDTSQVIARSLPEAPMFSRIRLTFSDNVMRLTGLRAGPLDNPAPAANTVPFFSETLPGPKGTDHPSPKGQHRIRVSGLTIDRILPWSSMCCQYADVRSIAGWLDVTAPLIFP